MTVFEELLATDELLFRCKYLMNEFPRTAGVPGLLALTCGVGPLHGPFEKGQIHEYHLELRVDEAHCDGEPGEVVLPKCYAYGASRRLSSTSPVDPAGAAQQG